MSHPGDNCAKNPGRYFRCERSGSCIPKQWRCDGDSDCGPDDRTDEQNCSEILGRCWFKFSLVF